LKLVFIIGTGRCGSTVVHEVLAKHERCGFVSNIEDNLPINRLGRWNNRLYRTALGDFTRKGGLRFAPSEAYSIIAREVSPIYSNSSRDLRAEDVTPWLEKKFRDFFIERYRAQRCDVFLHKYTGWSRIGFFAKIFPEAKFINIVRDGRAVANSWLQMDWWGGYRGPENWLWGPLPEPYRAEWEASGRSYATLAALSWKILMQGYHEAETALEPDRYLKLRFEDIVEDPRAAFRRMLEFSGLAWTPEFEKGFAKKQFNRDRQRAFETDLAPTQLQAVRQSLSSWLSDYGYE